MMHTVVETSSYMADAKTLLGEDGMRRVVDAVAANPALGDLMAGTGGFRKFRAARPGMGKRGGVRVISIYRDERWPVFLFAVFAKNEKSNVSAAERNALKKMADSIFDTYGAKR
jgi:hypothetical protein